MNTSAVPRDRGTVALELPLAVGLLLLPIAVVVMVLPQWPEAKTIAATTAKQAATLYVNAPSQAQGAADAQAAVDRAAANYGRPINASVDGAWCRGCALTVTITIHVPAVQIPFIGSTGSLDYTATSTARIPDYRSLG
jgi:hypothetical protein